MAKLIIVAGASGAGKTYLLETVQDLDSSIKSIKKLSDREPRHYETNNGRLASDLEFVDSRSEITNKCQYRYIYANNMYGIKKEDIDDILKRGQNPVLIVRSCDTILKIKRDYPEAIVLYLQSGLSGADLERKLEEQGRCDIDIRTRMDRLSQDFHDYLIHMGKNIFDYVLINYFDNTLSEQIQFVLQTELDDVNAPNCAFVIMSFNPELKEIFEALQLAGEIGNVKIKRIDEKRGDYVITEEIINHIKKASLIICDLTEERPNVYFELGYARAIGKKIILCAKEGTKLHFDVKQNHFICYKSSIGLQNQIIKELKAYFPRAAD